ncbi:MAG: hypothetical protein HGGPFJEG_00321 [Ignavibacteria bacterium]|nr:hypothetical protein [Ignavibacteria bacterium]
MKTKIKITNYFLMLFVMTSVFFAFNNPSNKNSISSNNYFKLLNNVTENDYVPNTVIFKLKERNRIKASLNSIDNVLINEAFYDLNTVRVNKVFANAVKPLLKYSADGEYLSDLSLIYIIEYNTPTSIEEAVNVIYNTGEVEYAQPKYTQKLMFTPNDPLLGSQYFINKIQAPAGWDIQQGDTNVVIGIVDTGTDWDHPDLQANIKYNYADPINGADDDNDGYIDNYRGWDLGDRDNDPMVSPSDDHGSMVSGCAAAVTNNGTGVSSPGFKCRFLPVKISNSSGLAAAYEGIVYAAEHGCTIINCSWGGGVAGEFEQDVINYVSINKNALVVCAAGNYNSGDTFYPADLKYVMSVASTNSVDTRSSFSNFGNGIDVCAPGESIRSTIYNNTYTFDDGTSYSSPICAGVCAIVKSQFPSYTGLQAGEKVRVTCDNIDLQNPSFIGKLGKGRINMMRALTISSPSVRLNSFTAADGNNNLIQPNDTITIIGAFKNYLDVTTNALVSITTTSTSVTLLNGSSTLGVIPTLGTVTNSSSPFRVIVNSNAPLNSKVVFKLNYTDGSYSDFEYFLITVNPGYLSINGNNITTTLNGKGNIGYNDYWLNTQGEGFKYKNGFSLLGEGGLVCATSGTKVSDCIRGNNPFVQNSDFTNVSPFQITKPGTISAQDGNTIFNDDAAGSNKIGIEINLNSYQFTSAADSDYVILKYRIKNTTAADITNFFAGLYNDWQIGSLGNYNKSDWDAANQMGYVWKSGGNPATFTGVSLLSANNVSYWAIDDDNSVAGNPFGTWDGFSDAEKYRSLSSGIGRGQAGGANGNFVSNITGSGPYSIPAGGYITITFALIAGDNLADLQANCIAAKNKYNSVIGITNHNLQVPDRYSLSQNYPNPFNPVTNLEFGISKSGFVSLKIYDVLGKEVADLVNENLKPGTYKYNFDATNLTSGIYFYKIKAGDFIQTRSMMLIK